MDERMIGWRCGNGHVMGYVRRKAGGISTLLLLRMALNDGRETPEGEIEVMACLEGFAADVRCSVCGDVRSWFPDARLARRR